MAALPASIKEYWYPESKEDYNPVVETIKEGLCRKSSLKQVSDYIPNVLIGGAILFYMAIVYSLFKTTPVLSTANIPGIILVIITCIAVVSYATYKYVTYNNTYLVGFATSELPEEYEVTTDNFLGPYEQVMPEESVNFVKRIGKRSGLGDHTHLPPAFHQDVPLPQTMSLVREELLLSIILACDKVFKETGISPQDIDCLITCCSVVNPTPSVSSMIINHYKMKSTIINYHFGGHGCAAGVLTIDAAHDYLRAHPNSNVLLYNTENVTGGIYLGEERPRLLFFPLFRSGGAASIMSNKPQYAKTAHYKLLTTERTCTAHNQSHYETIYLSQDPKGLQAVIIGKELGGYIAETLTSNFALLVPKLLTGFDWIKWRIGKMFKNVDATIPDVNIREYIQAFCVHSGGRAIIDTIQKKLDLTEEDCLPSRSSLYRFGNTSSASVWYEFNYVERCGYLQKGDNLLQVGLGSGLKIQSAVWKKIK
ncbi:3-ketoacyl-CoA synthase [Entamoeba marina]